MTEEGMTKELVDHILQNIGSDNLTDWERDFIKNVRAYWARNHRLSEKPQRSPKTGQ